MSRHDRPLSSRELLSRIGLSEDAPPDLFDEGALDDLEGDLGAVLRERFALLKLPYTFVDVDWLIGSAWPIAERGKKRNGTHRHRLEFWLN